MYSRLQFISEGKSPEEHYQQILKALKQGADWIQLRCKFHNITDIEFAAQMVKELKLKYNFTYIINDHVSIALAVDADGVHLGLADQAVLTARKALGPDKIIGGTANSYADIQQRISEGCDYIGLGPLRFTQTKEKLSPILGLDGYRATLAKLTEIAQPPIYAIGGVEETDIIPLREIGLHGIAVAGLINQQLNNPKIIHNLQNLLHEPLTTTR